MNSTSYRRTRESMMQSTLINVIEGVELKRFEPIDGRTDELAPIAVTAKRDWKGLVSRQ